MYKIIHNDEEVVINYRNDIVFKKTIDDNGQQADWLDSCSLQQLEKAFQLAIDQTNYKQLKQEILR